MRFIQQFMIFYGVMRSLLIYHALPFRAGRLRRFYEARIQPGDVCFDIGAHVGNHTRAMHAAGARVVAVEPQPHIMAWLRLIFGGSADVTLVEAAVGDVPGAATLHISHQTPTVTTLSDAWRKTVAEHDPTFSNVAWNEQIEVPLITLDTLIATHGKPALCKLDVEGYELQVLQGLSQPLDYVIFEYVPVARQQTIACIHHLETLDVYGFNWAKKETLHFEEPGWLPAEQMIERLAALRPDEPPGDLHARRRAI